MNHQLSLLLGSKTLKDKYTQATNRGVTRCTVGTWWIYPIIFCCVLLPPPVLLVFFGFGVAHFGLSFDHYFLPSKIVFLSLGSLLCVFVGDVVQGLPNNVSCIIDKPNSVLPAEFPPGCWPAFRPRGERVIVCNRCKKTATRSLLKAARPT